MVNTFTKGEDTFETETDFFNVCLNYLFYVRKYWE